MCFLYQISPRSLNPRTCIFSHFSFTCPPQKKKNFLSYNSSALAGSTPAAASDSIVRTGAVRQVSCWCRRGCSSVSWAACSRGKFPFGGVSKPFIYAARTVFVSYHITGCDWDECGAAPARRGHECSIKISPTSTRYPIQSFCPRQPHRELPRMSHAIRVRYGYFFAHVKSPEVLCKIRKW